MGQAIRRKDVDDTVEACIEVLDKKKFDSIAFRGMSGALIAPIVANRMNKELILVRKDTDSGSGSHADQLVEGNSGSKRYVILDDFISSGLTTKEIVSSVNHFTSTKTTKGSKLVGGVYYTYAQPGMFKTPADLII
jgi:adenine/guanine phosphoribosyltransferase-like PRPP-binding protein